MIGYSNNDRYERFLREERPKVLKFLTDHRIKLLDAEDLVQDICIRFISNFDPQLGFQPKTYLYSVVKNMIKEYWRDQKPFTRSGKKKLTVTYIEDYKFSRNDEHESVNPILNKDNNEFGKSMGELYEREMREALIEHLNPRQLFVLEQRELDVSYKEISAKLKISESRVYQINQQIQQKVAQLYPEYSDFLPKPRVRLSA